MTFHLFEGGVKTPHTIQWDHYFNQTFSKMFKEWAARFALAGMVFSVAPVNALAFDAAQAAPLLPYSVETSALSFQETLYPLTLKPLVIEPKLGESKIEEEKRLRRERITAVKTTVTTTRTPEPDLATKRALVQEAAEAYNVPWQVLEAVWQIESGKSWDTHVRSSAGAQGPAQFMPATWRHYGVDADGDGVANVHSAIDAVHGAARYLAANGAAEGQIRQALFAYNHANWYVEKVLVVAREIGYEG